MKTSRLLICLTVVQALWVQPALAQDTDTYTAIEVAMLVLLSNNSTTRGSISPSSHFVYPNSNVTPLGNTSAKVSKFSILFPPGLRAKDLDKLYSRALSKYQGADLILDIKVDTKYTTILFIFQSMKVTCSGTAAHMEVGKQDIGQDNFVPVNDNKAGASAATATTPPDNSPKGSVCFWTKADKYLNNRIVISGQVLTGVSAVFQAKPECSAAGTTTLSLKPGSYSYKVERSGRDVTGTLEVKADDCAMVEIE